MSGRGENTALKRLPVGLWLRGCRWSLAAGLAIAAAAGLYAVYLSLAEPAAITPERINPNTAPLGSLVRLPGIGKVRALDMIEWRDGQEGAAFESAASLEAVKGIGPKTVETMSEWLVFEEK
jgi:DNA uptake protein ComE-like DNA-binding protein